jgi:glutamyl-tRNA reductase
MNRGETKLNYLYNIDDLKSVAEDNLQARSTEAEKAEEIVRVEAQTFVRWLDSLEQVPTITALRQRFEDIRRKELEKSLAGNLKNLSEAQRGIGGHDERDDQQVAPRSDFSAQTEQRR